MRPRAVALALVFFLTSCAVFAETTRTVRAELTPSGNEPFVVENLAGTMKVLPGDGPTVLATATVHAESADLAEGVKLEQVKGENGVATLRVIYPIDWRRTVRYGSRGRSDVTYAGQKVRVSGSHGPILWAEVEVRVPRQAVTATFRNLVGTLEAEDTDGNVLLDAATGDITARRLSGRVKADTGSGDVLGQELKGSFTCDTGSGTCTVKQMDGDELTCDTGSGDIVILGARATRITADTGSGDVRVEGADTESFVGDTGSGTIAIEVTGTRLRSVTADTGSGDVRLRLPAEASFELTADQGSGDLECLFKDAQAVVHKREVVGYRRGDGHARIQVDTGSGSVVIAPR